jgi:SlyX protein
MSRHAEVFAMDELNERLVELEIRFSHQALLLEQLNEVVTASTARLDQLERDHRALRDYLVRLAPDDLTLSPDE